MPTNEAGLPRILLLSLVFAPDSVSTAVLMKQLAQELRRLGHGIVVLTTTPHYNSDPEALAAQPLTKKWGNLLWQSELEAIHVYHARVRSKGNRVLSRLIDYLSFHAIGTVAGLWLRNRYDLILAPSPPLTIGLSAAFLAAVRGIPYIYNVQEIYPDIAVSLGVVRNRRIIRLLERLEQFIYARATTVVVISENFRRRLLAKGVPADKVRVIPNFVDVDIIRPGDRVNDFAVQHQLAKRFVILYAGNIGLSQDFESIVDAARRLCNWKEIVFLIVGDGARREWLTEAIGRSGAGNVRLLPYQPRSLVSQLYASSDACLVPLRPGMASGTFPSKIYTIMAAGRPVLVSAEADTDLASIVTRTRCGLVIPPGDAVALADAVETLYSRRHTLEDMGRRGRDYVVKYHSQGAVALQYHDLVQEVTSASGSQCRK
jgi:colanic acid biosynthesis glycosyl transferase WcaI